MSSLVLLSGVGTAILLESFASPRSRPTPARSHRSDAVLRRLALLASLLLLAATTYAAVRSEGVVLPMMGALLIIGGGWLRATAMRNLGSSFRTEAGAERLVTTGVHKVMQHPSELGLILWALGLFAAAPDITAGLLTTAQLPLLVARLRLEERALADQFAQHWQHYASRTPRLGL